MGIRPAAISALHETVRAMVQIHGYPLEKALAPATENVAKALGLYPAKGCLAEGSDADLVLLDGDLNVDSVFAKGKRMLWGKEMQVQANFES